MTTIEASQLDLFGCSIPGAEPTGGKPAVALETRACGTCGGRGSYPVLLDRDREPVVRTCLDCKGEKKRIVTVKPDCPDAAKSYGMEPGLLVAMTNFTREMVRQGYGAKVETGGDLDIRKAKRCCNGLLRGVASDKPEPTAADWEEAIRELAFLSPDGMPALFEYVADDPDRDAHARKLRALNEGRAGK